MTAPIFIDATTDTDTAIDSAAAELIARFAAPIAHRLTVTKGDVGGRPGLLAFYSCFAWSEDSMGQDESSRLAVKRGHNEHVRR